MADTNIFYGLNEGGAIESTAIATSTGSTDVEVRVNVTKVAEREAALIALRNIEAAILKADYPFA